MKIVGIVGRAYYNKDNQKIFQVNEYIRKQLTNYDDVTTILLLPTENDFYVDINMGEDTVNENKLNHILNICDAFIVPGGTYFYNFDEYIIKHAVENDKPLLGICAGFQALCSLYAKDRTKFDMTKKLGNESHHGNQDEYKHKVKLKENTKLYSILNKDEIMVNSLHYDYMNIEMNELIISSISEDGIIESVELSDKKYIIGIQWHPEYLNDEESKKIFDNFINNIK